VVLGFRRIIHSSHTTSSSSSSPLHSHSKKAFGSVKKHSSANSGLVSVQVMRLLVCPRQLTFHRALSWRECKVASILMGGCLPIFFFSRKTHTCSIIKLDPLAFYSITLIRHSTNFKERYTCIYIFCEMPSDILVDF